MDEDDEPLTDDPEILALLDFEPVARKCKRHDGWTPANQRRYVVGLAETGNADAAAQRIGRTMSGAYKVRTSAGAEGFAAAWDGALALHHRRNPRPPPKGRPSRGEILAGSGRAWPARAAAAPAPEPEDPEDEERAWLEFLAEILERYRLKLKAERRARLEGRIVSADFYVRQLTVIELALDRVGEVPKLLEILSSDDLNTLDIVATPMSLLLDKIRRDHWREQGEPDRPPLPELGPHDEEAAYRESPHHSHDPDRPEDYKQWQHRRAAEAAVRAEAQRLWEEKAAKEAAAWRKRVEGEEAEAEGDGKAESDDPEPRP